jgi:hypothetical protein
MQILALLLAATGALSASGFSGASTCECINAPFEATAGEILPGTTDTPCKIQSVVSFMDSLDDRVDCTSLNQTQHPSCPTHSLAANYIDRRPAGLRRGV